MEQIAIKEDNIRDFPLPQFDRPYPWLVITHGEDKELQTFYDISEGLCYTYTIPELCKKIIRDVGNGWLFVQDINDSVEEIVSNDDEDDNNSKDEADIDNHNDNCDEKDIDKNNEDDNDNNDRKDVDNDDEDDNNDEEEDNDEEEEDNIGSRKWSLLNIVTMEEIVDLPPLTGRISIECGLCLLNLAPTNPDCRIIIYDCCINDTMTCKIADETFIKKTLETDTVGCLQSATMLEGKIYGLLMCGQELVVCDTLEEPYRFNVLGIEQEYKLLGNGPCRIVESCGEILLIVKKSYGYGADEPLSFDLYRADFSEKKWVSTTDIGTNAIFLNNHCGYSCSTIGLEGVEENCIYFTQDYDRNIHIFDLAKQSFSFILPCPEVNSSEATLSWMILPESNIPK